jgi:hypothetical protein
MIIWYTPKLIFFTKYFNFSHKPTLHNSSLETRILFGTFGASPKQGKAYDAICFAHNIVSPIIVSEGFDYQTNTIHSLTDVAAIRIHTAHLIVQNSKRC